MSRENVSQFTYHNPWSLISINQPNQTPPEIMCSKLYSKLELFFDDIDKPIEGCSIFTDNDATKIVEFVKLYINKVSLFVIHCHAGISRSAAIAAALSKYYNQNDKVYFDNYIPNIHVYSTLTKHLTNND